MNKFAQIHHSSWGKMHGYSNNVQGSAALHKDEPISLENDPLNSCFSINKTAESVRVKWNLIRMACFIILDITI